MSSSWRKATLKDWWPERSTGVWRIPCRNQQIEAPEQRFESSKPLRPILFLFRDDIDSRNSSSECLSPDSTPETSTCSHSTGTLSALKMVLTDSATSAPIPSPESHI